MGFGEVKYYSMPMLATSMSCSINLNRTFDVVYLQVPTMTSSTAIDCYGSIDGTNYYQIRRSPLNTSTVQFNTFTVPATAGANGALCPIQGGFQYLKFIATDSAPTSTISFVVVCGSG